MAIQEEKKGLRTAGTRPQVDAKVQVEGVTQPCGPP
jgi:hypothetical protein